MIPKLDRVNLFFLFTMINMGLLLSSFLVFAVVLNRALLLYETMHKLDFERENDAYVLIHVCHRVDYRRIGRHAQICDDIEQRLSYSSWAQALQFVIEDTTKLDVMRALQVTCVMACFLVLVFFQKWLSGTSPTHNAELPLFYPRKQLMLKMD